jgi:two-component system, NtrC family, response regulator AtoC
MTAISALGSQPFTVDHLLVIGAEPSLGRKIRHRYARNAAACALADRADEAKRLLRNGPKPSVVIAAIRLPDGDALELRGETDGAEWILLVDGDDADESARALSAGVFAALGKPIDYTRLDLLVASAARSARTRRVLDSLIEPAVRQYRPEAFLGRSAAASDTRTVIGQLCSTPHDALFIGGELGSGKRLAARILHYGGTRSRGPLIEMRCNALPKEHLEAALFGRETGTPRGLLEQADGGSLFLDEIAALPANVQAKLLRFIETKELRRAGDDCLVSLDVQLIAASSRDPLAFQRSGHFREDLLQRLSRYRLTLPSLRARIDDLDLLVPHYIARFNAEFGCEISLVPDDVWERLQAHPWPGNLRELRNSLERAVLYAQSTTLSLDDLHLAQGPGVQEYSDDSDYAGSAVQVEPNGRWLRLSLNGSLSLEDIDRAAIEAVLERHRYNVAAAARSLNTTRDTLRYRIRKYGISVDD